jgi:hypothetical protein
MQARQAFQKAKYDSDDQSSMMSEPGSPQDITMSDEDMLDDSDTATFSQSLADAFPSSGPAKFSTSPWRSGMSQTDRVPTPIIPPDRIPMRTMQVRPGAKQHIRQRHPQENLSNASEHLEVPSPIDEDEVPTPPSAAEAAGSQLSMLTVNDMDMEPPESSQLPRISISPSTLNHTLEQRHGLDSAIDMETMDDGRDARLIVRKQRQRSGALSSGQGSPSPVRGMESRHADMMMNGGGAVKRVLSMGFRADCEKCRLRVPGHMNHFVS